jgi:hypothetical protein
VDQASDGSSDDSSDGQDGDSKADALVPTGPRHLLLFGGAGPNGKPLGDTWTFDGTKWTQHHVPGPAARWGAVAGVLNGKVVLFGGAGAVDAHGGISKGDTWIWNGTSWNQIHIPGPPAREIAQGATFNGRFVVYGGYDYHGSGTNDVWSFNGTSWAREQADVGVANAPAGAPRTTNGLGTASFQNAMFLTDGIQSFSWNGSHWKLLSTGNPTPSGRVGSAASRFGSDVVVFGGSDLDGLSFFHDTWQWDGTHWHASTASGPEARAYGSLASFGNDAYLFGGANPSHDLLGDTWKFDGHGWTRLTTPGPSPRANTVLVAY